LVPLHAAAGHSHSRRRCRRTVKHAGLRGGSPWPESDGSGYPELRLPSGHRRPGTDRVAHRDPAYLHGRFTKTLLRGKAVTGHQVWLVPAGRHHGAVSRGFRRAFPQNLFDAAADLDGGRTMGFRGAGSALLRGGRCSGGRYQLPCAPGAYLRSSAVPSLPFAQAPAVVSGCGLGFLGVDALDGQAVLRRGYRSAQPSTVRWACLLIRVRLRLSRSSPLPKAPAVMSGRGSDLLEIDALDHGQALQETAQAIQSQFDRAQSDPFPSAENA
jgi:hypothetical protein